MYIVYIHSAIKRKIFALKIASSLNTTFAED